MNIITNILSQQAELPLLAALILGLLVAINPCQLAINISALTYLTRRAKYKHPKRTLFLYILGKTITYTVLGWILMCLIGGGRNIEGMASILSKAELIVPYILIIVGTFMLFRALHPHHHHQGENCHNSGEMIHRNGPLGALILGITLAFAFCPESAVFYFGLMLPLSITSQAGLFVLLIFAIAASIPVLLLAWAIRRALTQADQLNSTFEHAQQWINGLVGLLFILMAIVILFN